VLLAAQKLFAQRGYEGTSIGDVAALAEVGVGTVYHHFDDKRALLLDLLENYEGTELRDESGGAVSAAFEVSDVQAALEAVARVVLQLRREHPSVYEIALDLARRDPDVASCCERIEVRQRARIRADIEQGQRTGRMRSDIDPEAGALVLNQLYRSVSARIAEEPANTDLEPLIREFASIVRSYLAAR
jgi:AcrR family transcriptional regulator